MLILLIHLQTRTGGYMLTKIILIVIGVLLITVIIVKGSYMMGDAYQHKVETRLEQIGLPDKIKLFK
jgi:uncharacterized SAM-binding protein YcdF (DUF218 family)